MRARVEKLEGGREQEVVAVLRPEEVELAPTRDNLRTNFIANGIVEEQVFTGAFERMRVRMADGAANAHIATPNTQRRQRTGRVAGCALALSTSSGCSQLAIGSVGRHRRATNSRAADAAVQLHRVRFR